MAHPLYKFFKKRRFHGEADCLCEKIELNHSPGDKKIYSFLYGFKLSCSQQKQIEYFEVK